MKNIQFYSISVLFGSISVLSAYNQSQSLYTYGYSTYRKSRDKLS